MRPAVVLPTGRFLDGDIADAVIEAHYRDKISVTVMDERAGEAGVLLEILSAATDDDGRLVIRVKPLEAAG